MTIKWTYELVKEYFEKLGYELLSKEYINNRARLVFTDKQGYFYGTGFDNFYSGRRPRIADSRNEYSIVNIKNWLRINNKPFILISEKYVNKDENLIWKCLKEECNEEFNMTWHNVLKGQNCSVCRGMQVGISNCLATKNPELSKQFHTIKNSFTIFDVSEFSNKFAWWICEKSHEWNAIISSRVTNGCPYCAGKLPSDDYNLLVCHPKLCEEWNYDKNDKLPSDYCPKSNQSVFWKCNKCKYEWQALISNRTSNNLNCPLCTISKGEDIVAKLFKENDMNNIPQYKFPDCRNKRSLPFDFYLPDYNTCIEVQGIQHYESVKYFGGEKAFINQQIRDQIKHDYCNKNNIKLIEIPYWDFNNIESILQKELNII